MTDTQLYAEVLKYTIPPNHVTELALNFIKVKMNKIFQVAIHWRFDYDDWGKRLVV